MHIPPPESVGPYTLATLCTIVTKLAIIMRLFSRINKILFDASLILSVSVCEYFAG